MTADEDYGKVSTFRDALDAEGWLYVLEVPYGTPVFSRPVKTEISAWCGRGRKPSRARLVEGEPVSQPVEEVAPGVAAVNWRTLTVAEGAQGPRSYEFAEQRVWKSRKDLPGRECWLVLRRNLDGSELKCYLSNAPADTLLWQLAHVGSMRWCVEYNASRQTSRPSRGQPASTSMKFAVGEVGIIIWSWLC